MLWHELTSPKIDSLSREIPVVIPLGSCEQHGRHLPLFVDTIQLDVIVSKLERKMADRIVVAPTLWLGSSHHHLDFPGTLSVPPKLYTEIIQSLAGCFLQHGFRRLFFLNGHGGNVPPAVLALTDLVATNDRADAATMAFASWWVLASSQLNADSRGMISPKLTHACEYETSLILAIRKDLAALDELSGGKSEKTRPWMANPKWAGKVEGFHRFHRWTSTGHMGEPAAATKEKGESLLNSAVNSLAEFLEDFSQWPKMAPLTGSGLEEKP